MKKCTKCLVDMSLDKFGKDKYQKDGLTTTCKTCRKNYAARIRKTVKVVPLEKSCTSCTEIKKSEHFQKNSRSSDGLASKCKACTSISYKESLVGKVFTVIESKVCTICNLNKCSDDFIKNVGSKDGLTSSCKSCIAIDFKKRRLANLDYYKEKDRLYRENNLEAVKARQKEAYHKDVEETRRKAREYRAKNKQRYRDLNKKWRDNNKEKLKVMKKEYSDNNRDTINKWVRDKKKSDPIFKLSVQTRVLLSNQFNKLVKGKEVKSKKTEEILGCTMDEFLLHIESQFLSWMTWGNYGNCDSDEFNCSWHLDHIVAVSKAKDEEEFYKLNHWSNFQPLCGKRNLIKNGKLVNCCNTVTKYNSKEFKNNN